MVRAEDDIWPEGSTVSIGPLRIRLVGEIRSTQEELWVKRRWLEEGAGVAASSQIAGQGRSGKTWLSPEGGVYLSALVGRGFSAAEADVLGQAACLAVLRSAQEFLKEDSLFVKWPNDIVARGPRGRLGKLSGVLARLEPEGTRVANAVVGVGVNVRAVLDGTTFPPPAPVPVSLEGLSKKRGVEWNASRTKVLEWVVGWWAVLLERAKEDPDRVRSEYSREVLRAPLYATVPGRREKLRPLGVRRGGALEVRRESGKRAVVSVEDSERLEWHVRAAARPPTRKRPEAKPVRRVTARAGGRRASRH